MHWSKYYTVDTLGYLKLTHNYTLIKLGKLKNILGQMEQRDDNITIERML